MAAELLGRGHPVGHEVLADQGHRRRLELGTRRKSHGEVGVGRHVDKTGVMQQAGKLAPVGQIDASLGQQRPESGPQGVGQFVGRPHGVQGTQRLQRRIGILDEEPAAGTKRPDHRP
jgi:hypothetical protein